MERAGCPTRRCVRVALCCGLAAVLLLGFAVWLTRSFSPLHVVATPTVELRPILLADYYEHNIEHAPPRDPSGCMQRRERHYAAPADPLALVRAHLSQGKAQSNALGKAGEPDRQLLKWLEDRRQAYLAGGLSGPAERRSLETLLAGSSLSAEQMLEIGRGFGYLEGDELAACWYRAGLVKATEEYRETKPGEPKAVALLPLLDQTKALWRLRDHAALEKRFALAMRLNPPLSVEGRRAGYLHAEMLYYQDRFVAAADAMLAVNASHKAAGDLGALDSSDLYEMHWVLGLLLWRAGRHGDARPHLETVCTTDGEHTKQAYCVLSRMLIDSGHTHAARQILSRWRAEFGSDPDWQTLAYQLIAAEKVSRATSDAGLLPTRR